VEVLAGLVVLAVVVLVLAALARSLVVLTVHEYERGLRFTNGKLIGLLATGTHYGLRPFSDLRVLDVRPTTLAVEGQEVLSADGAALKASMVVRYEVGDAVTAVTGDADFRRALYVLIQLATRDVLTVRTLDDALATRREIGPAVRERAAETARSLGVELLSVDVRDLMVPGELKRAYASVLAARKEGEAALERARGETAALRNLANAGRLVETNPGLLQLRMLQELGASSGNTIVMGLPDTTTVVPRSAARRSVRETNDSRQP